ncbi:hypothetical protein NLU13_1723 [Sarocladium strictum]|uniref:C2H2-type domain-containing protein n=1 Tax=Sarocladium strictum TaxID=5046 RepID=A0AA39GRR6_SARSR|nr:hypothetical protein NLU13_1723 [Sarocladium strictum]
MARAEAGSVKDIANRQKLKGLQRLRFYCQVCEKQCRDANGFKMHTQSESHVRKLLLVGEDPKKFLEQYSKQFLSDFIQLLRTGHGEKKIGINRFYQEYIANKEHVHMNSTKWSSLTEFAKYLGREGICRVEETEKDGLTIAWIDNSPEALRRQDALKKKEAQDQGDDALEQKMIREQIRRAQAAAETRKKDSEEDSEVRELKRQDGEKIKLSFGAKPAAKQTDIESSSSASAPAPEAEPHAVPSVPSAEKPSDAPPATSKPSGFGGGGISLKLGPKAPQTKNVFAQAKKNALSGGAKKLSGFEQPKKMSEAERIMKEEMERKKRPRDVAGFGMPGGKKQKNL